MVACRERRAQIFDILKESNKHLLDNWLVMKVDKTQRLLGLGNKGFMGPFIEAVKMEGNANVR